MIMNQTAYVFPKLRWKNSEINISNLIDIINIDISFVKGFLYFVFFFLMNQFRSMFNLWLHNIT